MAALALGCSPIPPPDDDEVGVTTEISSTQPGSEGDENAGPDEDEPSPCATEFCDHYDGVPDIKLIMTAVNFTPPTELDVGGEVEVFAYFSCGHLQVVRDLASGELLLLRSGAMDPSNDGYDAVFEAAFGENWDELTAPLSIDYEDHEVCPFSQDACMYSRGSLDITLGNQPPSRVLDSRFGWAPGGYLVKVDLMFGGLDCNLMDVTILRDNCAGNCPPPTFDPGCEPPLVPELPDGFRIADEIPDPPDSCGYERMAFQCRVIGASAEVDAEGRPLEIRELDCAALFVPTQTADCCE